MRQLGLEGRRGLGGFTGCDDSLFHDGDEDTGGGDAMEVTVDGLTDGTEHVARDDDEGSATARSVRGCALHNGLETGCVMPERNIRSNSAG